MIISWISEVSEFLLVRVRTRGGSEGQNLEFPLKSIVSSPLSPKIPQFNKHVVTFIGPDISNIIFVCLASLAAAAPLGNTFNSSSIVGMCPYKATCNDGHLDGACVSISSGCCGGGTVTAGLCPGDADIKCCTQPTCSTPAGSGNCLSTSVCGARGGTSVSGYCAGPADLQCCVTGVTPGPSSHYDANKAVAWANEYCDKNQEWGCADFTARVLAAGGEFPGFVDSGNWNGYNLRWVGQLHQALLGQGWKQIGGRANNCGEYGDVLIYDIDGDPDAHAAFALGGCKLDQHNPSRCGTNSNWGPNIVLRKG